jgi:hypothetical protein
LRRTGSRNAGHLASIEAMLRPSAPGRRLWPLTVATLAVAAFLVGGAIERASRDPVARPGAPRDVQVAAATCAAMPDCPAVTSRVTLTWAGAASGGAVSGFAVLRDGAAIPGVRLLPADATRYVDQGVTPGSRHTYAVAASNDSGTAMSPSVAMAVPLPALSSARLDGAYRVRMQVRSAVNLASLEGIPHPVTGARGSAVWVFTLRCATPTTCVARWRGRAGAIRSHGAAWSGTVTGRRAACLGKPPARAPVRLHILAQGGAMSGGDWVVSRWLGTSSVRFHCAGFAPSRGTVKVMGSRR